MNALEEMHQHSEFFWVVLLKEITYLSVALKQCDFMIVTSDEVVTDILRELHDILQPGLTEITFNFNHSMLVKHIYSTTH